MSSISVLMSVYNGELFLREAMDSLLAQTFKDFELLVCDDGSTDRTYEILTSYAKKDARVKVSQHANAGLTATLNRLAKSAQSPLLARMDPDDVARPNRFERQFEYLQKHPEVVALGTAVQLIDADGVNLGCPTLAIDHEAIDRQLIKGVGAALCHPTVVIRRSAFEQVGGYDERYPTAQDLDLFLRLAEIGQLANLPEVLLSYRQHLASANVSKAKLQIQRSQAIVDDAHRRRGLQSPEPIHNWAANRDISTELARFGWLALGAGERKAAFRYSIKSLCKKPIQKSAIMLLACAVRGKKT